MGWGRNAILITVAALLLAGCGGGSDDKDNAQAPAPGATTTAPEDGTASSGKGGGSGSKENGDAAGANSPNFAPGSGGAATEQKRRQAKRRAQRKGSNNGGGQTPAGKKRKSGSVQIPSPTPATGVGITRPDTSKDGADRWKSTARSAYDVAKLVCGSGDSVADVAKELGLKAREKGAVAEEYSQEFPPKFRQAATEGCLVGLG